MKILIILVALLLLTGCSSPITEDFMKSLQNITTELSECKMNLKGYIGNATSCIQDQCPECIESDYLSLEQYQTMSTRIKWLEKRLDSLNSTERILELEENYTRTYDQYVECNNSINSIKELLK